VNLRTPRSWYQRGRSPPAVIRWFAAPFALGWARATARRIERGGAIRVGPPLICVGNLTLGGAGKTPIARELARQQKASGVEAHILMRGHGGRLRGPVRVDPDRHSAAEVGDEALMLANEVPVWIARDRADGAKAAANDGARLIILDDGHQNPALAKDLSLIVVDGETREREWPFGDGAVFPAGPMREPLSAGLARADAVVILLPFDLPNPDPELLELLAGRPILIARLTPVAPPPPGPQLAFAGLGKPWKMERALRAAGCDLVEFRPLADHQALGEDLLVRLAERANTLGAGLMTSEKDWVRLPQEWRPRIVAWHVRARFEDEPALDTLLRPILARM
jgi:tetraacyldisaccharide 4'-kinase